MENLDEKDIYVIEEIMGREISNFIKENRNIEKKELIKRITELLEKKDKLYELSKEEVEMILKNKKG